LDCGPTNAQKDHVGLIEQGCVPLMFAEGSYNQRLELISDFPRGKCISV
jgi:hypothetical protein